MVMEYTTAAQTVRENLAAGTDEHASSAALNLALQAWRTLAAGDATWDLLGLELLTVHARLYVEEQEVRVEADPPSDGPQTRTAVRDLLETLAQHHELMSVAGSGPLSRRLDHDAAAQQLRRAAAELT